MVSGWFGWQQFKPAKSNEIVVLVTQFEGPELENYVVADTIIENLEEATESYQRVKIKEWDKIVKNSDTARQLGEQQKASIVIWGTYGKTEEVVPLSVNFEVIKLIESYPDLEAEARGKYQTLDIAELEGFRLQTRLSEEMAYLTLFTVGMINYEAEEMDKAINYFTDALEQIQESSLLLKLEFIYFFRSNAQFYKKEYDLAISDYNKVIERDPNLAKAYNNRGIIYAKKEEYDLAISDYNKAIERDPTLAKAYNNRGIIYAKKEEDDLALADYNKAIERDPTLAEFYNNRGVFYENKKEDNLALADYNKAIELNPNLAEAYNNRGVFYENKRKNDLALADFNKVIKLNPNLALGYNNRGMIYGKKKEYNLAILNFNKAIKLNPNYAKAYHNRGLVYRIKSNKTKAIKDFKTVIDLTDDSLLRQKAEKELKKLENK